MAKEEELRRFAEIQLSAQEAEEALRAFADEAETSTRVKAEIVKKHRTLSPNAAKNEVKDQLKKDMGLIVARGIVELQEGPPLEEGKVMNGKQLYTLLGKYLEDTYTIPHSRTRNLLDRAFDTMGYDANGQRENSYEKEASLRDLGELPAPLGGLGNGRTNGRTSIV